MEDVDVGIVIPLSEEFEALTEAFGGRRRVAEVAGPPIGAYYRLTGPDGISVVAVQCAGQGPERAAIAVERLLHRYRVRLVCQIGIAGALSDDLMLGDIVVPRQIWAYHQRGKWVEDDDGLVGYRLGGEEWKPGEHAINAIRVLVADDDDGAYSAWRRAAGDERPDLPVGLAEGRDVGRRPACREIEKLASGPFVIASPRFWDDHMRPGTRLADAAEMEAAGVGAALQAWGVPFLVIRGISDFADGRKSQLDGHGGGAWRRYAARNAATFLWMVLPRCLPGERPARPEPAGDGPAATVRPPDGDRAVLVGLRGGDLLRTFRVVRLDVTDDVVLAVLGGDDLTGQVRRRAARHAASRRPELAAALLTDHVQATTADGPAWLRAQRAADLFTPELRPYALEPLSRSLYSLDPELLRHTITAVGRMHATGRAHQVLNAATANPDRVGKLGGPATTALARMFVHGEASGQSGAGGALATMLRLHGHLAEAQAVFDAVRSLTEPQERLLRTWLAADEWALVDLAATAFAGAGLEWARPILLARATDRGVPPATAGRLLLAVGMIGGAGAPEALSGAVVDSPEAVLGRERGLARCLHLAQNDGWIKKMIYQLSNHALVDVRLHAIRAAGRLSVEGPSVAIRRGLGDEVSIVRGMSVLAGARRALLRETDVRKALRQATGDVEKVFATLALLRLTHDSGLLVEIAHRLGGLPPLDPLLATDVTNMLRVARGGAGVELADAFEWLHGDG